MKKVTYITLAVLIVCMVLLLKGSPTLVTAQTQDDAQGQGEVSLPDPDSPGVESVSGPNIAVGVDAGSPIVGTNVRAAGGPGTGTQAELSMASSGPSIVITFNGGPNGSGFVNSIDGGFTFSANASPPTPMGSNPCCDSGVVADLLGRFYFLQLYRDDGAGNCTNSLHVSTDGGQTFSGIVGSPFSYASMTTDFPDMPHIGIDRVNQVGGQPQLYVYTRHFTSGINCPQTGGSGTTQGEVTCSTDGGMTWAVPIVLAPFTDTAHIATGSDASVYLVGHGTGTNMGTTSILLRRSTMDCNASLAFGVPVTVADNLTFGSVGLDREFPQPYVAVDKLDPDIAYVAWSSDRISGNGDRDIFLARCTFVGTVGNCGAPVRINNNTIADGTGQYFPMLCVDPNNKILLSWNDQRAGMNSTAIFHTEVTPNGGGFSVGPNFLTSEVNFTPFNFGGVPDYGDYNENNDACDGQHLYVAWTSHVSPPGILPASNDVDIFFAVANNLQDVNVNAPLDFGDVCIGGSETLPLEIFNVGDATLTVNNVSRVAGSSDISVDPNPTVPVTISPDAHVDFTIRCTPTTLGVQNTTIRVESDDPDQPEIDLAYTCNVAAPLATSTGELNFGDTCTGDSNTDTVQVCNTGSCNLTIQNVALVPGMTPGTDGCDDLTIVNPPTTPFIISKDFCFDFEVKYEPNDSTLPDCSLQVTTADGSIIAFPITVNVPAPDINVSIANSGNFGDVCSVDLKDLNLQVINQGACDLTITAITSSNPTNFIVPQTLQLPLVLSPNATADVPIRFDPDPMSMPACHDTTPRTANITIDSDDPDEDPIIQPVSGIVPCPNATQKGQLDFGELCIGDRKADTIEVCNTGKCNLTVTGVALVPGMGGDGCDDLTIINPPALPLTISKDFCFNFEVEFTPDDLIDPDCSLVITTDDPDTPTITFPITATVGEPNIVLDPPNLDGIYAFPATVADPAPGSLGCFSDKTLVIRNNGTCPLVISGIGATSPFSVIAPIVFPITLPVGEETLKVTVRFDPTSAGSASSPDEVTGTLTVMSNDPQGDATGGLCGEPVGQSGVRELVVNATDLPIVLLDTLTLTSKGINTPSPINIKLTDANPLTTMVCSKSVTYHLNREDLPTTQTTGSNPRSSYITKAKEGSKQASKSFSLGQCEFKEFILKLK